MLKSYLIIISIKKRMQLMYYCGKKAFLLAKRASVLSILFATVFAANLPVKKDNSRKNEVLAYLSKYEAEAWQKLEKIGIARQACQAFLDNLIEKPYSQEKLSKKPLSKKIKAIVAAVMSDFNIDLAMLKLQAYYSQSEASTTHDTLFIDERGCLQHSENALRFIIAHELQHVIYNDYLMLYSIETLSQALRTDKRIVDEVIAFYSRFTEERADLMASLNAAVYAQGFLEFTQHCLREDSSSSAHTETSHPSHDKRLHLAHNVCGVFSL